MTKEGAEGKVLGKKIAYPKTYNPGILVAVPRKENRDLYNIFSSALPFIGYDTWHAYEIGFLCNRGLPIAGVLKIIYPSNNEYIVESKSLKLYLNSFNHEVLGQTKKEAIETFTATVKKDLSTLLQTKIELCFFEEYTDNASDFENYTKLENQKFASSLHFDAVKENPDLLHFSTEGENSLCVYSDLLRSNCKITNQPDWGSVFIHIESEHLMDASSILAYIVSFRNENHFHEEVCEMIYTRILNYFSPTALAVTCLYTRRGGIDICPTRASSEHLLPKLLVNANILTGKTLRQ